MIELLKWYQFLDQNICQTNKNGLRPCQSDKEKMYCQKCFDVTVEQQYKTWKECI